MCDYREICSELLSHLNSRRQHTSAYVSRRQHMLATSAGDICAELLSHIHICSSSPYRRIPHACCTYAGCLECVCRMPEADVRMPYASGIPHAYCTNAGCLECVCRMPCVAYAVCLVLHSPSTRVHVAVILFLSTLIHHTHTHTHTHAYVYKLYKLYTHTCIYIICTRGRRER